ncbi:G-protein coupled receptor moody isoform X2 [Agrilus planipennis]|nr:G-protein coupled receptor moody isoform X2 [Agrilus planipennis]
MLTAAGVATILIMVVGIAGNLLTVIALLRNSKIRTVAAAFIASLCISDLLFCLVVLPFAASQFFLGTWIHGDILCYIIPMMRYGSVGVSLLSVATISINRYILIAWPNQYTKIYTKTKVAFYISLIWLFSYGTQIPTLMGMWGVFGFDKKLGTCSIKKDQNGNSPKVALFVLGFVIPCLIIVICYSKIYWVVHKSQKRLQQHGSLMDTKRSEMRVTRMVLVIFFCFVICYLPLTLVKVFDGDVKYPAVHILGYLLLYCAACVNPVIYVTMNKQYRQAYFDTLKCRVGNSYDSNSPIQHHSKSIMSVMFAKHNTVSPNPKA